jgi:hypothetical protein
VRGLSISTIVALSAFVAVAGAREPCLTFEVLKRVSVISDEPNIFVERLPISQADIRSAVFEVWEPSEETKQHFASMGRAAPSPRPQVTVALSERAAVELQRVTQQYHQSSPPHHLRISRPGFEAFQPRMVTAFKGSEFILPVSGPAEAEQRIPMFMSACE